MELHGSFSDKRHVVRKSCSDTSSKEPSKVQSSTTDRRTLARESAWKAIYRGRSSRQWNKYELVCMQNLQCIAPGMQSPQFANSIPPSHNTRIIISHMLRFNENYMQLSALLGIIGFQKRQWTSYYISRFKMNKTINCWAK